MTTKEPVFDENQMIQLVTQLNSLTTKYMNGSLKPYQYTAEYDNILANYNINKAQLRVFLAQYKKNRAS